MKVPLKELLEYLDGLGLIITDWEMINEYLENYDLNLDSAWVKKYEKVEE